MKKLLLLQALTILTAGQVMAEPAEFTQADADKDGILSINEAKEALPELVIVDVNDDGLFNLEEAAMSIPALGSALEQDSDANPEGLVGNEEYDQIVQALMNGEESS